MIGMVTGKATALLSPRTPRKDRPNIHFLQPTTMKRPASLKGFTLIELLIVIVIIGILSAGAFALFTGSQAKARDAIRKSDIKTVETAIQLFMNDNSDVAPTANELKSLNGGAAACTTTTPPAQCATGMLGKYLQKAVAQPKAGEVYCYYGNGSKYALLGFLEEGRPSDLTVAALPDRYVVAGNYSVAAAGLIPGAGAFATACPSITLQGDAAATAGVLLP